MRLIASIPPQQNSQNLSTVVDDINQDYLVNHPFKSQDSYHNTENLLAHYLAMSLAFPYLQAGSQANYILNIIEQNSDIPREFEKTSVVGNFLSWDETGGLFVLEQQGKPALAKILETQKWFHGNLLRNDLRTLFGRDIKPNFSDPTKTYLQALFSGLGHTCHITRCAYMLSFENHAFAMIDALWETLASRYSDRIEKNGLVYFNCHVGGDDPAEIYHTEMTAKLLEDIVEPQSLDTFIEAYKYALKLHIDWCSQLLSV